MDIKTYLERIQFKGSLLPTIESLRELQLAHLRTIPFENLSIHKKEPIILKEEVLFDKLILKGRGGFCYELNGLFATLLRELGFNVLMLSGGVAKPNGGFGPDFDHMTLMVLLEERWLVDVGFGDSFEQPLLIDERDAQLQGEQAYRIDEEGNYLILNGSNKENVWKPHYRFSLNPYELTDFEEMCNYHQTSPESIFTRRRICSLAKPDGRITLSDMRLIETLGGERRERVLMNEEEYAAILKNEFGIVL
ncbi:MAG: arylamine N-acetyltransferase [Ignavibacteriaceae bacterium]|jgi:N-hydroxyarylamine O-acetyltransferase